MDHHQLGDWAVELRLNLTGIRNKMALPQDGFNPRSLSEGVSNITATSVEMLANSLGYQDDDRARFITGLLESSSRLSLEEQLRAATHLGSAALVLGGNSNSNTNGNAQSEILDGSIIDGTTTLSLLPTIDEVRLDELFDGFSFRRPLASTQEREVKTRTHEGEDGAEYREFDRDFYPLYRQTPANMRNFISDVMPDRVVEECFNLTPLAACLIIDMLTDRILYLKLTGTNSSLAIRERRAKYIAEHTGLIGAPKTSYEVQEKYQVGNVYAEISKAKVFLRKIGSKGLEEILDAGIASQLLLISKKDRKKNKGKR